MTPTTCKPSSPTSQSGVPPEPPETHQKAGGFSLVDLGKKGYAAMVQTYEGTRYQVLKEGSRFLIDDFSGAPYAVAESWLMKYQPGTVGALNAAQAVAMSNNGYADIGTDSGLVGVLARVMTVIRTRDLHGRMVFRGFTARAQAALRDSPFGVSTYKAPTIKLDLPDMEAAILARQERFFEGF